MTPNNDKARTSEESASKPITWDADEALTWVSYGIFRHVKNHTQPAESELVNWWNHILATQVAIGALVAECEAILSDGLPERSQLRLELALSRMDATKAMDANCETQ